MCHRAAPKHSKNCYMGLFLDVEHLLAVVMNSKLELKYTAVVRYDVDLPEYGTIEGIAKDAKPDEFKVNPVMYVKALDILFNCLESQGAQLHRVVAIGGAAHHCATVFWTDTGFRRLCGLNPMMRLHEQLNSDAFEMICTPSWAIRSSISQCYEMEEDVGGGLNMIKITGSKCYGRLSGPQIRKMYDDTPELYDRTVRISLMSSFLASLLVGSIGSIDYSDGSGMNLLDITHKTWSPLCLAACAPNLQQRLMSPIASNRLQGRISDYYVKRWNFRPDCMIVSPTGCSASIVSGLNLPENYLVLKLTNVDRLLMCFKERPQLEDGFLMCHPTNLGEYYGLLLFRNGSEVRESICKQLAKGDWKLFNEFIEATPMGNRGNIEVRLDKVEYTPEAKGTLRWDKNIDEMSAEALQGRAHFDDDIYEARAIIEGQIMHRCVLAIDAGFKIKKDSRIVVLGNHPDCPQVLQIIANVFNMPVYTQDGIPATLLGATNRARYAFYEYREANCNCQMCKKRHSSPKLSFAEFFKHLPEKLKLSAEPQPGCAAIYNPLIERCRSMCRVLAASTYTDNHQMRQTV